MAKCRKCGHEFTIGEELYVDGFDEDGNDLYHCTECHDELYTAKQWYDLSFDYYDNENEVEIISDDYYFTSYQGED